MLEELSGLVYGPYVSRLEAKRVADYVVATGDDPRRWTKSAPPSLAGALLFEVAPHLLADPRAAEARSVIHGDQTFTWHRRLEIGAELAVTGTVGRVRSRGGVAFVSFDLVASDGAGPVLEGASTFLMSGDGPATDTAEEEVEPHALVGSSAEPPVTIDESDGSMPTMTRSASRLDLVRYAAASGDFNPIHWDHAAAVAAGLPGVVCHGLLESAWLCQFAARLDRTERPLASARFRYRAPLRPAVEATASGSVEGSTVTASLDTAAGPVVTAVMEVAR